MSRNYLEVIEAVFPEEPPTGSVVLGKSGIAWQSYTGGDSSTYWVKCPIKSPEHDLYGGRCGQKWGYLMIEEAPLKLLWKGSEDAS